MSFNIRNIREISNDPLTKFTNQLAKKLSKFLTEQETGKLENKEDIYSDGQDVDVALKFNSLGWTNSFDGSIQYFPTFEPDLQYNTCWIKGINIGNETRDLSEFGNVATITGDPVLMDGTPFDLGISLGGVKSTCLRFNGPATEAEDRQYIKLDDNSRLQLAGISTGMSYFIRFRLHSLSQQNGFDRTLYHKMDDNTIQNAVWIVASPDGRLKFQLSIGGIAYNSQTAAGTITTNTVYECWFTFDKSGNVRHIYVDNVDKSLTDPGTPAWAASTDHNGSIFARRFALTEQGYVYGDFYDFIVYREKVISAAEVGYHYNNKWTIANIPFGQCMITNYWATAGEELEPAFPSYTSLSYTTISYTMEGGGGTVSFSSTSFSSSSFKV